MTSDLNRAMLRSRYQITGRLVMTTALHIGGGGQGSAITDSPVVKLPTGEPFIPGSSLRGAFRAAVERLAATLGLRTCALADDASDCLSAKRNETWAKAYRVIRRVVGRELGGDGEAEDALTTLDRVVRGLGAATDDLIALGWPQWSGQTITEDHVLTLLEVLLCDTCKTFGSVHLASNVGFHDLAVEEDWVEVFQVRDGVGIDRDSERARPNIKFDFEVVPPDTAFALSVTVESPSPKDLALVALGLQEFMDGAVAIGGIRSRGLGRCRLEDVKVRSVNLRDAKARTAYLLSRTMNEESGEAFVARHLELLAREGG